MAKKFEKIAHYSFTADQYMCNFRKQIFTSALINQILATADYHSTERDFGTEQLAEIGKTWVLSRFAIEIEDLPPRHAKYDIETYIESAQSFFSNRNFVVKYKNGKNVAVSKSTWSMLDIESRKPQNVLDVNDGLMKEYIVDDKKKALKCKKPDRVNIDENLVLFRTIETYYNDIDFNGHINSCRYIEHILDLFSMDWHKKNIVKRLDVVFVSEAHCGDKLKFYCSAPSYPNANLDTELSPAEQEVENVEYKIRVCKVEPGSDKESECVRVKLLWRKI